MDSKVPGRVQFTSVISADRKEELEALMFFNENQAPYRNVVIASIERFGEPGITNHGGVLRVRTTLLGEVQALFAVEHRLDVPHPIAVAVYARTAPDTVTLLHIVVHRDFAATGPHEGEMVTFRLIQEVAKSVSRIKNVRKMEMLYGMGDGATTTMRVGRKSR
jgi:hypothetical protein